MIKAPNKSKAHNTQSSLRRKSAGCVQTRDSLYKHIKSSSKHYMKCHRIFCPRYCFVISAFVLGKHILYLHFFWSGGMTNVGQGIKISLRPLVLLFFNSYPLSPAFMICMSCSFLTVYFCIFRSTPKKKTNPGQFFYLFILCEKCDALFTTSFRQILNYIFPLLSGFVHICFSHIIPAYSPQERCIYI